MSQVPAKKHYHHGRTPAAWASTSVAGIGFIIGAVAALMGPNWPLVWVATILVLASPIIGGVMRRMGLGQD
jgi:hypothetical protein